MDIRWRLGTSIVVGVLAATASGATATTGSSELNLRGGDKLQANAFHCGIFFSHCSWSSSAKLLGKTPDRASWIRNNAEIRAHGPSAKITLGKSSNVEIEFKSKTLIKTRWTNTKTWISDSSGKVSPSKTTTYVSTKSSAYAYHPAFGKPGPVVAYAGAF
jgi:hypothetical protein